MMKKIYAAALLLCAFQVTYSQVNPQNFSLVGHVSYNDNLADIEGYVAPGGTEYALVGHENGVSIVSLATPANPVELYDLPGINTIWREIATYQTYAYVTNEAGDGLRIINLSNLPGPVTYKDTVMNGMDTHHSLMVEGNRLYIHGSNVGNGGVRVYSLANPWKPSFLGTYDDFYVHDAYYRNNIGYLGEIYDGFMEMVDFTNPASPVSLGSVQTPDQFTHNTWLNDAGNVCYTTDEVDGAVIAAYDITDPTNIVEIDRICSSVSNCQSPPHNVKVLNDYLITSYYRDGVYLVDGARPHNLIEIGWFDSSILGGAGFNGAWSSDPYLPSGLVLIGDMEEGLFIVQPNYVRGCYLEGIVTDSVTGLTLPGASIQILTTTATDVADNAGEYATGLAAGGNYQVTYSKFGYVPKTINVTLSSGNLVIENVELRPLATVNYTINVVETGTLAPISGADVKVVETSVGGSNAYVSNGSGVVNDPAFVEGTYEIYAGKWGYRTAMVNTVANGAATSVTVQLEPGYYDDFFFDNSWVSSNLGASSGMWEMGEPVGTFSGGGTEFNPEEDVTGDFGDQCYVTGNGGGSTSNDDVDDGEVQLEAPAMNLASYNVPILRYQRWFANGGGFGGNPNDSLRINISNGFTNVVVDRIFGNGNNQWRLDSVRIADFITPTANMIVFFTAGDYGDGHLVEAAIDQFEVYDASPASAPVPVQVLADLTVYPNPMGNQTTVEYYVGNGQQDARFVLTDVTGRVVFEKMLSGSEGKFTMDLHLPQGIYAGSLFISGEAVKTMKLVK